MGVKHDKAIERLRKKGVKVPEDPTPKQIQLIYTGLRIFNGETVMHRFIGAGQLEERALLCQG